MSNPGLNLELEEALSHERQTAFDQLSNIFDPKTARDYVYPKAKEVHRPRNIDELAQQGESFKKRPSRLIVYTTAKHNDDHSSHDEFVRRLQNYSDEDALKQHLDLANGALNNSPQSLLLFHSSKLNEHRANVLKSSAHTSGLHELNTDSSIQKYFAQTLHTNPTDVDPLHRQATSSSSSSSPSPSMHIEYKEKRYCVEFLKDAAAHQGSLNPTTTRALPRAEKYAPGHPESSLDPAHPSIAPRQPRPPLSLSALREHHPTVVPRATASTMLAPQPPPNPDFIWQQSMVPSTDPQ